MTKYIYIYLTIRYPVGCGFWHGANQSFPTARRTRTTEIYSFSGEKSDDAVPPRCTRVSRGRCPVRSADWKSFSSPKVFPYGTNMRASVSKGEREGRRFRTFNETARPESNYSNFPCKTWPYHIRFVGPFRNKTRSHYSFGSHITRVNTKLYTRIYHHVIEIVYLSTILIIMCSLCIFG